MLDKEARRRSLEGLKIRALDQSRVGEAVNVVARGMRDNPLHLAAYGEDPECRLRKVHGFVSAAFAVKDFSSHSLVARRADGAIVGVGGMLPPGDCLPTLGEKVRMMPRLLSNGPRTVGRVMRWLGVWDKHHPKERHWHLGPLAVDAHLQGMGVGSKLMKAFCTQMDAAGEDAYLETDKEINVRFYERFGFEVISEEEVLGAPNWFMLRQPGSSR
jgi:ribosomal protein S18 acetylase RimI-like enzyme